MWKLCSPKGWVDFDEIFYKWSDRYLRGPFLSDFEISKSMTSWRPFCTFSPGHSHAVAIFVQFTSKIAGEVESCLPLFAIENQRGRLVTSANMADRVLEKIKFKMAAKIYFFKQGKWGDYFDWNWPAAPEYDDI